MTQPDCNRPLKLQTPKLQAPKLHPATLTLGLAALALTACTTTPTADERKTQSHANVPQFVGEDDGQPLPMPGEARDDVSNWPTPDGDRASASSRSSTNTATQPLADARPQAIEIIRQAFLSSDPQLRTNAVEAVRHIPDVVQPTLSLALMDPSPPVRFAALMTMGDLRVRALADAARPLLEDSNPSVQCAAIYAMRRCGREVNPTRLFQYATAPNPGLRGNAYLVLGRMGDPSAVPMLREAGHARMLEANPTEQELVQLQLAEALLRLTSGQQQQPYVSALRAGMYGESETRVFATTLLGEVGDAAYEPVFRHVLDSVRNDELPEQRIAAATALARLGEYDGLGVLLNAAELQRLRLPGLPRDRQDQAAAGLRAQAAFGLGYIPDAEAAEALVVLLEDEYAQVRLSAAAAIARATAP